MAIKKKLIHFKKFTTFNSKKLSANESNDKYTVGISDVQLSGSPDILYQSIVYIQDTQQQWTHGTLYSSSSIKELSYSDLFSLYSDGLLVPGTYYRITDYVTTTSQAETQSALHQFDIIVLATSSNALSEDAYAIQHDGDTYFSNQDLSSWDIKYTIHNNVNEYGWANSSGCGVIYYMKDEFGNEAHYDFKNIRFQRTVSDLSGFTALSGLSGTQYFYTFSAINNGVIIDDSCKSSSKYHATDNILGRSTAVPVKLSNTIFIDKFNNGVFNNQIKSGHANNTFGSSIWNNVIDYNFTGNKVGDVFQSNHIGTTCKNNVFSGNNFCRNIVSDDCQGNTFSGAVNRSTFGLAFAYNQLNVVQNCVFGANISRISNAPSLNNINFSNNCISGSSSVNLSNLYCIDGQTLYNSLSSLTGDTNVSLIKAASGQYLLLDSTDNALRLQKLEKNIYDLGSVSSSADAESAASNSNICSNSQITFIKYNTSDNSGLITQIVGNNCTYQYIDWNGSLKYRKITWTNLAGTISTTSVGDWISILDKSSSDTVLTVNGQQNLGPKNLNSDITIAQKSKIRSTIDAGEFKVTRTGNNNGFIIRTNSSNTNSGKQRLELLTTNGSSSFQYNFPFATGTVALQETLPPYLSGGEQTTTSSADGGSNVFTFNRTDGETFTLTVKNGSKGSQGARGDQGIQGPQGNRGLKGDQGPQGNRGNQGVKGDQGPQGNQGAQGSAGLKGDRGLQGVKGDQGPQGNRGLTGDVGPQGPKGDKGDQGTQGPRGNQGLKGDQGVQGPKGDQGVKGDKGPQGDRGLKGDQGPQGNQGNRGLKGDQGPQGNRGFSGGTGPTGPTGPQGNRGNQGPKGDQGPQGNRGFSGGTGPTGPQGPRGHQGVKGDTGPQGNRGYTGYQGVGISSIIKTAGTGALNTTDIYTITLSNGATSTFSVTQGTAGAQGAKGSQGNRGNPGAQGNRGNQGPKGDTGPQGNRGFQGAVGSISGYSVQVVTALPASPSASTIYFVKQS